MVHFNYVAHLEVLKMSANEIYIWGNLFKKQRERGYDLVYLHNQRYIRHHRF